MGSFSLSSTTKERIPRIPLERIKDAALGASYNLSLVFIGEERMRTLNRERRGKDKSTNILSFPLSPTEGEIYISLAVLKREAKKLRRDFTEYTAFLFIHGLFHLKGLDHGSTMERKERELCDKFSIEYPY